MEARAGFGEHMPFPSITLVILSTACEYADIYPATHLNIQAFFSFMPAHLVTLTAAEQRKLLGNLGQRRALTADSREF